MIDSDNVLLLRPAQIASGFSLVSAERQTPGATEPAKGLIVATVCSLNQLTGSSFTNLFERTIRPVLLDTGALVLSYFVTENHLNTFPRLPVRENENVFVWFSMFPDLVAYDQHVAALAGSVRWTNQVSSELARCLKGSPETLRLQPTPRSLLRA